MTTQDKAPEEPESTVSTGWIIAFALLIPIILLGTWYVTSHTTSSEYVYNGFVFQEIPCEVERCWQTTVVSNIGEHPILFFYGPREVEDIAIDYRAIQQVLNLTQSPNTNIVIAFDEGVPGEVGIAAANIARITGDRFYRIPTRGGVYGQDITCTMASPTQTVIYLTQDSQTGVYFENNCVLILAPTTQELVRVADAYVLHLLNIMQ